MMPTPRVVKNLTNMEFDEISLVDRSANQHADVAISKRAPEEDQMPQLYHEDGTLLDETNAYEGATVFDDAGEQYVLEANADDTDYEDDADEAVEKSLWSAGASGTTKIAGSDLVHVAGAGKSHRGSTAVRRGAARVSRGTKKVAGNRGAQLAGAAGVGYGSSKVHKSFSEVVLEDISKAFTDDDRNEIIAKALEAMEHENQEAYEIAKSERDLRLEREYIAKADTYGLPIDSAELGPVLYRLVETMSPEDAAVIAKALDAAGEATSALFDEIGQQGGGANSDIMQMVDVAAGELITKADGDMDVSKAAAVTQIFDENPDGYAEYLRDRRGF